MRRCRSQPRGACLAQGTATLLMTALELRVARVVRIAFTAAARDLGVHAALAVFGSFTALARLLGMLAVFMGGAGAADPLRIRMLVGHGQRSCWEAWFRVFCSMFPASPCSRRLCGAFAGLMCGSFAFGSEPVPF